MDLRTTYLGLKLANPLIVGASPLVGDLDAARRLEDAGAAALVMHSLFEEQLASEQLATAAAIDTPAESFAEATSYFPTLPDFKLGPEQYLTRLGQVKQAVGIPVFGSLNGTTRGGWLEYARLIEQAGADALELNTYDLAVDLETDGAAIEDRLVALVEAVRASIKIPLAVKLSPFYTALPNLARRLIAAGADGLVLFNRFYQPDIDVEQLEVMRLNLSDPSELLLRLHWLALLSGRIDTSLAATGGAHSSLDVIKAVMAGADAVQMVSALLKNGPEHLTAVRQHISAWMEEHEYASLTQMQGSMDLTRCPDPKAYQRANYIQLLESWRN